MTQRFSQLILLFAAAGVAVAVAGCDHGNEQVKAQQAAMSQQRPPAAVTAEPALTRDVPVYLDEIGNTTAYQTVSVQPQVSGPIADIHFTDGAEVKKGDLLFTIDPRPFQAALDRAKATY